MQPQTNDAIRGWLIILTAPLLLALLAGAGLHALAWAVGGAHALKAALGY